MKQWAENVIVWSVKILAGIMFVTIILICIPFAIIGDMMNEGTRRIKR